MQSIARNTQWDDHQPYLRRLGLRPYYLIFKKLDSVSLYIYVMENLNGPDGIWTHGLLLAKQAIFRWSTGPYTPLFDGKDREIW